MATVMFSREIFTASAQREINTIEQNRVLLNRYLVLIKAKYNSLKQKIENKEKEIENLKNFENYFKEIEEKENQLHLNISEFKKEYSNFKEKKMEYLNFEGNEDNNKFKELKNYKIAVEQKIKQNN